MPSRAHAGQTYGNTWDFSGLMAKSSALWRHFWVADWLAEDKALSWLFGGKNWFDWWFRVGSWDDCDNVPAMQKNISKSPQKNKMQAKTPASCLFSGKQPFHQCQSEPTHLPNLFLVFHSVVFHNVVSHMVSSPSAVFLLSQQDFWQQTPLQIL